MSTKPGSWLSVHSYVAAFFLPVAVIFAVTGGLSAVEEHGERVMGPGLAPHGPGGPPEHSAPLRGTIESRPNDRPVPALGREGAPGGRGPGEMRDRGLYGKLLLLHKAKGSPASAALAVSFACAMLVIYFTGIWVCWGNRKLRGGMLISAAAGLIVTIAVVAASP